MKTASFIAKRYLFSKKSTNVINIISGISATGIAVGVAAMIIILSAINGLEGLVGTLSSTYDPDIKISAVKGKTFDEDRFPREEIKAIPGVEAYSDIVEELCIIKYHDRFVHAMLKGVEEDYFNINHLKDSLEDGEVLLEDDDFNFIMTDIEVAAPLDLYVSPYTGNYEIVTVYAPIRNKKINLRSNPFKQRPVFLSGVFISHTDDELKPVLVSKSLAQDSLLEYGDQISSVEIKLSDNVDKAAIQNKIEAIVGPEFSVKNRLQQNEIIYKVSESEKFFVFVILAFVLLLTSFNILASLTMLIIDKKKDIYILRSMGADKKLLRSIFFREGLMINAFGAIIGLTIGTVIVLLQYYFHLIPLHDAVIDYYPVALRWSDYLFIGLTISAIAVLCSYFPVRYLIKKQYA